MRYTLKIIKIVVTVAFVAALVLLAMSLAEVAEAAITQRQAPVQFTNTNYPAVLVFPTAPVAHDLLVVGCSGYSGATITAPAGWTQVVAQSGGYWQQNVFYHAVASGEANSYTVGNNNTLHCVAYDMSGAAFYGPMDTVATAAPTSSGTSYTTPSATGTVVGDLPMTFLAVDDVTCTAATYTGTFSTQSHPVCAAYGPVTTDTTTAQNSTYTLSAASTEGFGAATILIKPYDPTPIAPVANSGSGYSGILPNTIQFDGSGSGDPKQETLTYAWTFGDGATGTGVNPAHSYSEVGNYITTLTVTNTDGLTNAVSTTVVIQVSPTVMSLGKNGALNGWSPSPADAWHQDVSAAAVDPNSAGIQATVGGTYVHPDFGSTAGGGYGIPYIVVDDSTQPLVPYGCNPVTPDGCYLFQGDVTVFPIPTNPPIEGSPAECETAVYGDNHLLTVGRATGRIYALWQTRHCAGETPQWSANGSAVWDGKISNQQRPYTFTSEDAGGLSVFSGLIRYDEVQAVLASPACVNDATKCYLSHATRMTIQHMQCHDRIQGTNGAWLLPAIHSSCNAGDLVSHPTQLGMWYGDRWRLQAGFDISGYSPANQVILRTWKKYGLIVADIGSDLYVSGTQDDNWNDGDLHNLANVPKSAFDILKRGTMYAQDLYPAGTPPTITSFTASPSTIVAGQSTTLSWSISNLQNGTAYIDKVGMLSSPSGSMTFTPATTTALTLTAQNRSLAGDDGHGNGTRPIASQAVTVTPYVPPPPPTGPQRTISGNATLSGTIQP